MRQLTLPIIAALALWGCGDNDPRPTREDTEPAISPTAITVTEGTAAYATVTGAERVAIEANAYPDIFAVELSDATTISVTGLHPGNGTAYIIADDARLTLSVTVTPSPESEQYDFTPELTDSRTRFVSRRLTLLYDTPGTIVSRSVTSGTLTFRDLNNGNYVEFTPGGDDEGPLPAAKLQVNGQPVALGECALMLKTAPSSRWYSLTPSGNDDHIVIAACDI